ncbi:MAG: hypothetical protein JRJ14_00010 [Deltaproteobacteria bacterium]|jgi:hypothetical protein|nr:hypothetical protein [Deltaproteobacteria bacterium]
MYRITNPNIDIFECVVERFGELVDKMVFLGGCASQERVPIVSDRIKVIAELGF